MTHLDFTVFRLEELNHMLYQLWPLLCNPFWGVFRQKIGIGLNEAFLMTQLQVWLDLDISSAKYTIGIANSVRILLVFVINNIILLYG